MEDRSTMAATTGKPSTRRKPTIRASLVVLVLACIVPAGMVEVVLAYRSFQAQRQQLLEGTLDKARGLATALDGELIAAQGALWALSACPELAAGDYRAFYDQARQVQAQQKADNVVLAEPSGQQVINTLKPFGTPLPMSRSPRFAQLLQQTEGTMITDLFVGAVSQDPHFALQIPIRRDGRVVNTLAIGMFPQRIADILPRDNALPGQVAGILDGSGAVVARSVGQAEYVGRKVPPELLAQMAGRKEGYIATPTADGTPAILLFSRSSTSRWVAYLTIPEAYFTQRLWDSLQWVVAIPLLLLAAALGFVWLVGGAIARSITGLTAPALALGYGQQIEVGPLYLREADEVGRALVEASTLLRTARYEAQHDPLTGLANRALFDDMVYQQVRLCQRMQLRMAVLYIDLDGFKAVNDTHGHAAGDELLRTVATRLLAGVRASDIVARLGGDEFAVLLMANDTTQASAVAQSLIDSVSAPYPLDGDATATVSASIGIAGYPDTARTDRALLQAADAAMYQAKRAGKRRCVVAEPPPGT